VSDLTRWVRHITQSVLHRFGVELARYYDPSFLTAKRREILQEERINLVLDVGANVGQYAEALRASGFRGRIVSFEPTSVAFAALEQNAARDESWSCERLALSDRDGDQSINVSGNSWSSSLLPMTPGHIRAAPHSAYIGSETVRTSRLDSLTQGLFDRETRAYLKLDVQGHELSVLRGADEALEQVPVLECELSVISLYEGQPLVAEVLAYLTDRAFSVAAMEPVLTDPENGQLLQLDGLFVRRLYPSTR
jgi:FkbM family methyltransferase